jgi:hypothetical protein
VCDHPAPGRAAGLVLIHEPILARLVLARHGLAPTPVVGLAPKSVVGLDPQGPALARTAQQLAHGPPLASCPRTLRLMMAATLTVRMQVQEKVRCPEPSGQSIH